MKKIAIIGAQNSGKTTSLYYLCYKLKKIGMKLGIGHETARECPYPLNDEGGFLTQFWILSKQIERESKLEGFYEDIILDRSVFDIVAYSKYLAEQKKISKKDAKFLETVAETWAKNHPYTLIIYLDPLPLEEDPARGENTKEYQDQIVRKFQKILKKVKCPIIRIKIAPKEVRSEEVYRIVRRSLYGA